MGYWNYFFIAKLLLLGAGVATFHVWANLLFAVALILPLQQRRWRWLRNIAAIPLAVTLLYYDTHLPPLARLLATLPQIEQFSAGFLVELIWRTVNVKLAVVVLVLFFVFSILNRWIRGTTFVLIAIVVVPWIMKPKQGLVPNLTEAAPVVASPSPVTAGAATVVNNAPQSDAQLEQMVNSFFKQEASRKVDFPARSNNAPAFDIIILQICSLAWSDMEFAKQIQNPLMSRFDYVLRQFNSAASYSGPAAIRLLRASCGQPNNAGLYAPDAPQCHVMHDLQQLGFTPQWAMNHDGHFDNFAQEVSSNLETAGVSLMSRGGVATTMHAFDKSPIVSDNGMLETWWKQRQAVQGPVALFYNSISLHDGNVLLNSGQDSLATYPVRLKTLLDDIDNFISTIEKSGRKALVIFVPEHGAATQGDALQVAGLREIPTPLITHVPVGIKLVGVDPAHRKPTQFIDTPTSYLALAQLISNAIAHDPFNGDEASFRTGMTSLPQTAPISDNDAGSVIQLGDTYYARGADGVWLNAKGQ